MNNTGPEMGPAVHEGSGKSDRLGHSPSTPGPTTHRASAFDYSSPSAEALTLATTADTASVGFDYADLDTGVAETARDAASRIRAYEGSIVRSIITIGQQLLEVKKVIGHGHFGRWLAAEFDWTERTAQRFMSAAVVFDGKSDIVSELPESVVYKLAAKSTPAAVRDDIVQRLERGERPTATDIIEQIDTARELDRQARRESRLTEKQSARKKRDRAAEQQRRELQEREDQDQATSMAARLYDKMGPDMVAVVLEAYDPFVWWRVVEELRRLVIEGGQQPGRGAPSAALIKRIADRAEAKSAAARGQP